MQNSATNRPGQIAVFAALLIAVMASFLTILAGSVLRASQALERTSSESLSLQLAESGVDRALWCLNNNAACPSGYSGESDTAQGAGTFSVNLVSSGNDKVATATGVVRGQSTSVRVTLAGAPATNAKFFYGIQTGAGGVTMSNSSRVVGNLYSSGPVTGVNSATITGDAVLTPGSPTLDQTSDPPTNPLNVKNLGDVSANTYVAQSFVPGVDDKVYSIDVKVAKHCPNPCTTFPGSLTMYLYTDNGNKPGTNLSGSGQILSVSTLRDTDPSWYANWTTQTFAPANLLQSGVKYWLVLKASGTNASNYWILVRDSNDQSYTFTTPTLGTAQTSNNGTTWSTACTSACDVAFRTKMGGVEPTLSMNGGVGGSAYAYKISSTNVGKDAYYQQLSGTVKANTMGTAETCTLTPPPGSHCHKVTSDQPPQPFPVSDAQIASFEAQAMEGTQVSCAVTPSKCTLTSGTTNIGPAVYTGNVSLSNTAIVNLRGVWWIKGNLDMANTTKIQLDKTVFGTNSGVIIVDDPANRTTGSKITFSNSANLTGTYESCTGAPKKCSAGKNAGNTCTVDADCPTGNYIMAVSMNSDPQFTTTAINIANSLSAGILYAPNGKISLSNSASLVEVTAQLLDLANSATVTYDSGLQDAFFSSGPGGAWQPKPQTWQEIK